MSSISSFDIISVVVLEPKIFYEKDNLKLNLTCKEAINTFLVKC